MSIHNAIFDLSAGIKHAAKLFHVMRTRIYTNESPCPFYLVGLDTDGGGNHNHYHGRNQLSISGLFLLGNMDNLNVKRGCLGLYFINTSKRDMPLLTIDIYGLVLKSNVQLGDEFFMDKVIGKA